MAGMNDVRNAFVGALTDGVSCRSVTMNYESDGRQRLTFDVQASPGRRTFSATCEASAGTSVLMAKAVETAAEVNAWAAG